MSVPVRAGGGRRVSARPGRLVSLAETAVAVADALRERAGYLADACDLYESRHGLDRRADVDALPGALDAWADALAGLGEWTGCVGEAFLAADGDDAGGVHRLSPARLRRLLPAEARPALDDRPVTGTHARPRDWGAPDDPPPWLTALRTTDVALARTSEGLDTATVLVRGGAGSGPGAAGWRSAGPTLLGRLVEPATVVRLDRAFGVAGAGVGGVVAARDQAARDRASLAYTPGEVTARAVVRGGGEAAVTTATGAGGVALAGLLAPACAGAAPVCAGVTVVGLGLAGSWLGDAALDRLLGSPKPGERDPGVVRSEVRGPAPRFDERDLPRSPWGGLEQLAGAPPVEAPEPVRDGIDPEPGYRPVDVPDRTWDLVEAIHEAGETAAPAVGGEREKSR